MFGLFLLVFFLILFLAGLLAMPCPYEKTDKQTDKAKKRENRIQTIGIISAVIILLIPILYGVGWVWYYLCGGFMVTMEDSFFWKIVAVLITLIPLGFLIGVVAICCGWNPYK